MVSGVIIKMDFRLLLLAFIFFIPQVSASPMTDMDELVPLVYQYPSKAAKKIKQLDASNYTLRERLRLQLVKCELLNQNGEGQAAINLAQLAIAQAKANQLEEALPYFYICMADGYSFTGQYKYMFSLLDSAISSAKQHNQLQALVNGLRNRAQFDTETEDFSSAIEDLRLAIDLEPQQFQQKNNWLWAPRPYIYLPMAYLFFAMNEVEQSVEYLNSVIESDELKGKMRHKTYLSAAKIYYYAGKEKLAIKYIQKANESSFELDSEIELAGSKAILASLEYELGNYDKAETLILWSINVLNNNFKLIKLMRTKRTLAKIKFAIKQNAEALKLMNEIIEQAKHLSQYIDLQEFYHILEKYYISQGDSKKAYQNLKLAYEAGNQANKELNSARFIQYKARLDRQASIHSQQRQAIPVEPKASSNEYTKAYKLVFFVLGMLGICVFFVLYQNKRRAKQQIKQAQQQQPLDEELNQMLIAAKKQTAALSLLLVNIETLGLQQLDNLKHGVDHVIRESDMVMQYSSTELLVVLPNTTNAGAQKVVANLHRHLMQSCDDEFIFGMASMQQFDQIGQLMKRANFDRLTQIKNREIRTTKYDEREAV